MRREMTEVPYLLVRNWVRRIWFTVMSGEEDDIPPVPVGDIRRDDLARATQEIHREFTLAMEHKYMVGPPAIARELGVDPAKFAAVLQEHWDTFVDERLADLAGHVRKIEGF